MMRGIRVFGVASAVTTGWGCIPYTVGGTAQPVPPREVASSMSLFFLPDGFDLRDEDSTSLPLYGLDGEARWGLNERADVGVRITTLSGVVVTYKHRLSANPDPSRPALAVLAGGGFVNAGEHLHVELSLLASGAEHRLVTPYGGVRGMQVVPIGRDAVSDTPTLGGFLGVRIGDRDLGVSPEIGVFYDKSALGVRDRNVIIVPAVTVHGRRLIEALFR